MPKNRDAETVNETASEPLVMLESIGEPIKIRFDANTNFKPEQPRKRYWCGIVKKFDRFSYVGVSVIQFNQITDPPRLSKDGTTTTRNQYFGSIESLTDEDVATIIERVKLKVIRGGRLTNLEKAGMKPQPGDIPLARYLYMVRLPDGYTPSRDTNGDTPEPMAQEE